MIRACKAKARAVLREHFTRLLPLLLLYFLLTQLTLILPSVDMVTNFWASLAMFSLYGLAMGLCDLGFRTELLKAGRGEPFSTNGLFGYYRPACLGRAALVVCVTDLWVGVGMLISAQTTLWMALAGNLPLSMLFMFGPLLFMFLYIFVALIPYLYIREPGRALGGMVKESVRRMSGYVGKYILLSLSFIGWAFLARLPLMFCLGDLSPGALAGDFPGWGELASLPAFALACWLLSTLLSGVLSIYITTTHVFFFTAILDHTWDGGESDPQDRSPSPQTHLPYYDPRVPKA